MTYTVVRSLQILHVNRQMKWWRMTRQRHVEGMKAMHNECRPHLVMKHEGLWLRSGLFVGNFLPLSVSTSPPTDDVNEELLERLNGRGGVFHAVPFTTADKVNEIRTKFLEFVSKALPLRHIWTWNYGYELRCRALDSRFSGMVKTPALLNTSLDGTFHSQLSDYQYT